MKRYGVGILGNCCTHGAGICGMLRRRDDTRVVAAYEKGERRGRELAEALGAPLAASCHEVLAHPQVDVVAIASDPCDKAGLAEKAAASGKHILLNKPFCDNPASARRIRAAVAKHGVHLVHDIPMVRSVPVFARLLDEVRAGTHGKVMGYHHLFGMNFALDFDLKRLWPERLDPREIAGGGELTNMGCYAVDFAVALFGLPAAVTAKCRKTWDVYADADTENYGQIVLDYGDFFAFLHAGKQQLAGEHRHANAISIIFEHRTFCIDAVAGLVTINHVPQDFPAFAAGAAAPSSIDQLIAAMEGGARPDSGVDTGVMGTDVLAAVYGSVDERRTIRLPLSPDREASCSARVTDVRGAAE